MRPAVSISFCTPVKRGWHLEQISTLMFWRQDRVWMTSPQAQLIVVSTYLGWIPSFMTAPLPPDCGYSGSVKNTRGGSKSQGIYPHVASLLTGRERCYI